MAKKLFLWGNLELFVVTISYQVFLWNTPFSKMAKNETAWPCAGRFISLFKMCRGKYWEEYNSWRLLADNFNLYRLNQPYSIFYWTQSWIKLLRYLKLSHYFDWKYSYVKKHWENVDWVSREGKQAVCLLKDGEILVYFLNFSQLVLSEIERPGGKGKSGVKCLVEEGGNDFQLLILHHFCYECLFSRMQF